MNVKTFKSKSLKGKRLSTNKVYFNGYYQDYQDQYCWESNQLKKQIVILPTNTLRTPPKFWLVHWDWLQFREEYHETAKRERSITVFGLKKSI